MAGAKGYRSYRGRGTKKKILLAVLLCLVILAAAVVIWVQGHMVYDADGTPHLDIPWQQTGEQEPQEDGGALDPGIPEGGPDGCGGELQRLCGDAERQRRHGVL